MKIDYKKYPLPKRLRHHTKPNFYFKFSEIKELPEYYPPIYKKFNWNEIYSNSMPPDFLDIGCGKGTFLLNMAEIYPQKNLLGIEIRKTLVDWLNNFIKGENIQNCYALWYSVVNGLKFIENQSIEKIFYLFPDPWTKRKHIKRRAFDEDFLNEIYRILKPDGQFFLASDIKEIDDYHRKLIENTSLFNFQVITNDDQWQFPATNKEMFCRKENIEFYRLICSKKL